MRLTRKKDEYECRIANCNAEEWMNKLYGDFPPENLCDNCPFESFVNKLAEFEDKEEETKHA